ncbi:MAG TPA: 16S rRNA (cytosine(967)-C(5))-methyltransferase [Bacteroidetes bacterium]|nr:16S rRNA (cytosine(967)-C(5))-methyltransferase [Bacteroidota bacterium]
MKTTERDPRKVAVEIISRWDQGEGTIDTLRDEIMQDIEGWDERDRALVTELVFGVARHKEELDRQLGGIVESKLGKMQRRLYAILLVGMYQWLYLDRVPSHAIVYEAVNHARELFGEGPTKLVNAVLRRVGRELEEHRERPVNAFYAGAGILHQWRSKWINQWNRKKADELVSFLGHIPPVGLRRNRLKTRDDDQWFKLLVSEGLDPQPIPGWPGYAYIRGVRPSSLQSFKDGLTTVQDPAAGIAPAALDPRPGERILDLCCAPGGKTALLWELMGGKGTLLGVDRDMKRNRKAREALKRLGHSSVKILTADAITMEEGRFDRVRVDVPCSGTGVSHRRADLLLRHSPLEPGELAKIQRSILAHASEMVKPGGILVYSTCSLEPEENEQRVKDFEKKHGDRFERDELPESIPREWCTEPGIAATWPPKHGVDGAFVVRWKRRQ